MRLSAVEDDHGRLELYSLPMLVDYVSGGNPMSNGVSEYSTSRQAARPLRNID